MPKDLATRAARRRAASDQRKMSDREFTQLCKLYPSLLWTELDWVEFLRGEKPVSDGHLRGQGRGRGLQNWSRATPAIPLPRQAEQHDVAV